MRGARFFSSTGLWLAVLVLAGAAVVWQALRPAVPAAPDEDNVAAAPLVAAPEAAWSALELLDANGVQRFERDAAGRWLQHADVAGEPADHRHRADAASADRIAGVFATFARTGIERSLPADPARLAAYGLDRPALIVLVRGPEGRPLLTLEVGQVAPDGLSRYVRTPRDGRVLTIANYQVEGLLALGAPGPAASAASAPGR